MLQELTTLQESEQIVKKAIAEQEAEQERLDGEENRYWREYSRHRLDLLNTEDDSRR